MKRSSFRDGLIFCAITTFVIGAGSHVIAQNQPAAENPSTAPAAAAPQTDGAEQANRQNGERPHVGLGFHFETQGTPGRGLEIASVDPNSAAAQAGLQAHDRLISIDGRPFRHHRHAKAYLSAQTGRPVPLIIERNGRQLLLHFVPGEPEGDTGWVGILLYGENETPPNAPNSPPTQPNGGQNGPGARVAQIYPGSPAARAGLQPGDLVTQINGTKIDDPAELIALVHEMKPQTKAEFEVMRDNQPQKVSVTVGSRRSEFAESQPGPDEGQAGPDSRALERLAEEVRQLREEVHQLREQLQKK
jgi:S1-C subfamily serine protease